jgi:hypothetical protein
MFDLPTGLANRVGTTQPAGLDERDLEADLADWETVSEPSNVDDEEWVFGFKPPIKKKAPRPSNASHANKSPISDAITALAYEQQLSAALKPKPRTAGPYPPQLSNVFQQAGFLYSTPPSINFNPSRDYSLRELKDACRRFPLEGWEDWCDEPKDMFTKWMLNEMGAFMSLARGDPLKPIKGIARGFEKWKVEQDA